MKKSEFMDRKVGKDNIKSYFQVLDYRYGLICKMGEYKNEKEMFDIIFNCVYHYTVDFTNEYFYVVFCLSFSGDYS